MIILVSNMDMLRFWEERDEGRFTLAESMRRRLERHAKYIEVADGTNREALRVWIQAVDNAALWTQAEGYLLVEMAGYLSKGSLSRYLLTYRKTASVEELTWANIRSKIDEAFDLNLDGS